MNNQYYDTVKNLMSKSVYIVTLNFSLLFTRIDQLKAKIKTRIVFERGSLKYCQSNIIINKFQLENKINSYIEIDFLSNFIGKSSLTNF